MAATSTPPKTARGTNLLLRHCAAPPPPERAPARERLARILGEDFARALVAALTDELTDPGRPRSR